MVELNLVSIGIMAILLGFALVFAWMLMQGTGKAKVEGGGIIFIGPFPIIGATSGKMFYMVLALSAIFLLAFIVLNLIGR
jgi:uncharacterized membrane protein